MEWICWPKRQLRGRSMSSTSRADRTHNQSAFGWSRDEKTLEIVRWVVLSKMGKIFGGFDGDPSEMRRREGNV
ncbi:hypothetical protein L484_019682 [Morus notabilis]|uniref:Uncharacterized protein n=1 Tax=Morus notabilis TaxID=981085 RepID=W9QYM0_9ROSA|nr:hypothetical protein L484_019682 [Morus notabilis]